MDLADAPSTGYLLWHAALQWQSEVGAALGPLGLTPTQFFVLGSLVRIALHDDKPNQRELAAHAGLDAMTVSQIVRRLEGRGLIARHSDPDDARAFRLSPTPAGRALVERAAVEVRAATRRFFAPLGARERSLADDLREVLKAKWPSAPRAGAPARRGESASKRPKKRRRARRA